MRAYFKPIAKLFRMAGFDICRVTGGDVVISPVASSWTQRRLGHEALLAANELSMVLRTRGIELVIDVGANRGQFASRIRQLGFLGLIVSYEPNPVEAVVLKLRARGDANWKVVEAAVGAGTGSVILNISRSSDFSSVLSVNDSISQIRDYAEVVDQHEVALVSLDNEWNTICGGIEPSRTLLKVDTQGYDHAVFLGASSLLGKVSAVLFELPFVRLYKGTDHYTLTLQLLESSGLGIVSISPIVRERESGCILEADCLLQRRDLRSVSTFRGGC